MTDTSSAAGGARRAADAAVRVAGPVLTGGAVATAGASRAVAGADSILTELIGDTSLAAAAAVCRIGVGRDAGGATADRPGGTWLLLLLFLLFDPDRAVLAGRPRAVPVPVGIVSLSVVATAPLASTPPGVTFAIGNQRRQESTDEASQGGPPGGPGSTRDFTGETIELR